MFTMRYVREHLTEIKDSMERRKNAYPLDELLKLDEENRAMQKQIEELRAKRNKGSIEVSEAIKEKGPADESKLKELSKIKEKLEQLEEKAKGHEDTMTSMLWKMPNTLDKSVPFGNDGNGNIEIRHAGKTAKKKGPSHEEPLKKLGLIELEQAAKVSGARFYYMKGDLVVLEQALIRFAIDLLSGKGYLPVSPPLMLKKEYYKGVTALSDFEEALYKVGTASESSKNPELEEMDGDLMLISTSEHPLAALNAKMIFSAKELPKKYIGVSPCFRREAGSHGKDTKGIFRVHHFYKVEQFVVSRQEDSQKFFEELIANAEEIYKKLEIPYRVMNICTGEIGTVAAQKYDIEAYMPAQDTYREVVSASNCTDWQSLRLDIRYDEGGERKYAHTLNSTAIATTRTIVAIVENYLNPDGTIAIPEALVPYMNGKRKIG